MRCIFSFTTTWVYYSISHVTLPSSYKQVGRVNTVLMKYELDRFLRYMYMYFHLNVYRGVDRGASVPLHPARAEVKIFKEKGGILCYFRVKKLEFFSPGSELCAKFLLAGAS